ncbi:SDR family oxidoreductase [Hellea sp.]|nr:SDR family oxidoreductase [Hellea sp.]MDA8889159.1 SDR family oxidoreductase [Hellea sp.]MDB4845237.1 SDR family oxidoreductase [Hellea sp.]MDC1088755.1 SDR family NAD(P)-dependent oxidoreductase [Hellea sp.]
MITGAAGGIGSEAAKLFAQTGATLLMTDISENVLSQAELVNQSGGKALAVIADISKPDEVENVVATGVRELGRLDFAFNNAGIGGIGGALEDLDLENWNKVVSINLSSVAACMKYQAKAMRKNGGGVIVNNSSVLGLGAIKDSSLVYTAAKHGVIGLTKQAALNYGPDIRINAVCPGLIDTSLVADGGQGHDDEWFMQRIPVGRKGLPIDIGNAVLFLCSDMASYMTGSTVLVDGGFLLS